jgi:hypothetical protein
MIRHKFYFVTLIATMIICWGIAPATSHAVDNQWLNFAKITEIGPSPDGDRIFIKVVSPDEGIPEGSDVTFLFAESIKKECLAVALTAMSLGKTVRIRWDADLSGWPVPNRFYIND